MDEKSLPNTALRMVIRRIPATTFDKGPLAGIPTTVFTQQGLPMIQQADETIGGQAPLSTGKDDDEGALEPLPDRMLAIHWRTHELWLGIGDGYAIPLPANIGFQFVRLGMAAIRKELDLLST